MAPYYGWGSTASRLESLRGSNLLWSPPVVFNSRPLDLESSALTELPEFSNDLENKIHRDTLEDQLMCIILQHQ